MARFTDELRALAGTKWNAVVEHRFTDELAAGTVADGVLARYLIQDHRFLDACSAPKVNVGASFASACVLSAV